MLYLQYLEYYPSGVLYLLEYKPRIPRGYTYLTKIKSIEESTRDNISTFFQLTVKMSKHVNSAADASMAGVDTILITPAPVAIVQRIRVLCAVLWPQSFVNRCNCNLSSL